MCLWRAVGRQRTRSAAARSSERTPPAWPHTLPAAPLGLPAVNCKHAEVSLPTARQQRASSHAPAGPPPQSPRQTRATSAVTQRAAHERDRESVTATPTELDNHARTCLHRGSPGLRLRQPLGNLHEAARGATRRAGVSQTSVRRGGGFQALHCPLVRCAQAGCCLHSLCCTAAGEHTHPGFSGSLVCRCTPQPGHVSGRASGTGGDPGGAVAPVAATPATWRRVPWECSSPEAPALLTALPPGCCCAAQDATGRPRPDVRRAAARTQRLAVQQQWRSMPCARFGGGNATTPRHPARGASQEQRSCWQAGGTMR